MVCFSSSVTFNNTCNQLGFKEGGGGGPWVKVMGEGYMTLRAVLLETCWVLDTPFRPGWLSGPLFQGI